MELQVRRNSFKSEDVAPQTATSLTQAPPRISEFAAESSLTPTTVLNNRCDVCSQNLRACIVAIEHAVLTNGNTLEKVRLQDLQTRLQVCYESLVDFVNQSQASRVSKQWILMHPLVPKPVMKEECSYSL